MIGDNSRLNVKISVVVPQYDSASSLTELAEIIWGIISAGAEVGNHIDFCSGRLSDEFYYLNRKIITGFGLPSSKLARFLIIGFSDPHMEDPAH